LHSLIPPSPRLWRGKPAVAEAMAGQARPSIHTLTRSPAFAWLRRAKSHTLSTPEEHLIRPSATFSPSNAEKGNLMGEGYEGESSAASLKNLRRDGPDGQPHLKWICSSFAPLSLGAFALNAFLRQCCGNLSKGSKGSNRIFALFCSSGRRPGRCLTGRRWFPLPAGEHRGRKSLLN